MFQIFLMMIQLMDAVGYNITKINELLLINRYHGKWESLTNNPFNYLEQKKGETFIQFKVDIYNQGPFSNKISSILIYFLDPSYFDEKQIIGQFKITDFNEKTLSWHGKTNFVYDQFQKNKVGLSKISCEVEYTIQLNYHQYEVDQKKIDFTVKLQNEKSYDKNAKFKQTQNIRIIYQAFKNKYCFIVLFQMYYLLYNFAVQKN